MRAKEEIKRNSKIKTDQLGKGNHSSSGHKRVRTSKVKRLAKSKKKVTKNKKKKEKPQYTFKYKSKSKK